MFDLRRKAIFAAALSLAAFSLPAVSAEFSASQKTEIEGIVHSYLLAHPEVLREVSVELEKRQKVEEADLRGRAIANNKQALFDSPFQATIGNPKGKITLVEFFDYNCGYCKRALVDLVNLVKAEPELRVVLKDFPVLGANSVEAAQVASAARKQISGDKFFEFHQKLLMSRGPVGREQALAVAKELGLDMDRLQKDLKDPSIRAGIEDVMKIADALALTGTPSYVVGDEAVVGAVGFAELKTKVDAVGKCGKTVC
ncbi:DsbA family protein [uncultured Rhodoblastus sp.]|uniref:DsbA family protein n=1 Tax=uncultured Rhodoblastus sp. TaxID=543037 RepID=UPI0025DAAB37|nr:DsbA family protein [uncultured Rhodoblastus sp.]